MRLHVAQRTHWYMPVKQNHHRTIIIKCKKKGLLVFVCLPVVSNILLFLVVHNYKILIIIRHLLIKHLRTRRVRVIVLHLNQVYIFLYLP